MSLVVISTALRPDSFTRSRCEDSVRVQTVHARHIYIVDDGTGYHLENLYNAVHSLAPADIVLSVDGDDWLCNPRAIEIVANRYAQGAWMTWGQYMLYDGKLRRPGHCHDARNRRAFCRVVPWYASHLKTFRAGLFQQIKKEHLQRDGQWLPECCDMAFMFPMLEMADERGMFISDVLYAYEYTARRLRRQDQVGSPGHKFQLATQAYVRSLPMYDRLESEPW